MKQSVFEKCMGKELPCWKYISTKEDWAHFSLFQTLFEKQWNRSSRGLRIPKKLHFIWLGSNAFPVSSIANVDSWAKLHPDWEIYLWADWRRIPPHARMQLRLVHDFSFAKLKECYEKTNNLGEKADILRYEILYREGGVYVDHDVKCLKPFATFNETYDFYCGLDLPAQTPLSSTVHCTNSLIGTKPGHPILQNCLDMIDAQWLSLEHAFLGQSKDATIMRIAHRTFFAFDAAVREYVTKGEEHNIVFPTCYFNAPREEFALYAWHQYAGTWFAPESSFEKIMEKRLLKLSRKNNQLLMLLSALIGMNLIAWILVALFLFSSVFVHAEFSFEELMGKGKIEWEELTQYDREDLAFYKGLYEKQSSWNKRQDGIPKVLHFIWLGKNPFPQSSVEYVTSWKRMHPHWTMKFWTDLRDRGCPIDGMEKHLIDEIALGAVLERYRIAENWGEKSDILRYLILSKEGGVYVDHDVECHGESFDAWHETLDFYAFLEKPHRVPGVSTRIFPGNAVIGSRAGHPILEATLNKLVEQGCSFGSFVQAVRHHAGANDLHDLLFPAACFVPQQIVRKKERGALRKEHLLLVTHHFASSWIEKEPWKVECEKNETRTKRLRKSVYGLYGLSGANLLLFSILLLRRRRLHS
jgi:mannosyltransferase OCH1-like enzyme